jgi:hypothetical protein
MARGMVMDVKCILRYQPTPTGKIPTLPTTNPTRYALNTCPKLINKMETYGIGEVWRMALTGKIG